MVRWNNNSQVTLCLNFEGANPKDSVRQKSSTYRLKRSTKHDNMELQQVHVQCPLFFVLCSVLPKLKKKIHYLLYLLLQPFPPKFIFYIFILISLDISYQIIMYVSLCEFIWPV